MAEPAENRVDPLRRHGMERTLPPASPASLQHLQDPNADAQAAHERAPTAEVLESA